MPNHPPQNLTVATTGASGALFLRHFLLAVARDQRVQTVNFIASDGALRVMAEELDLRGRQQPSRPDSGPRRRQSFPQDSAAVER